MAVTTPAMPGTTVPVTNPTGQEIAVTVTGGTVSAMTVNGNAVTSPFALPPLGAVVLTYSAAPTWLWQDPLDEDFEGYAAENTSQVYNQETDEPVTPHEVGGEAGLGVAEDN